MNLYAIGTTLYTFLIASSDFQLPGRSQDFSIGMHMFFRKRLISASYRKTTVHKLGHITEWSDGLLPRENLKLRSPEMQWDCV